MLSRSYLSFSRLVILAFLAPALAFGQAITGTLVGTVRDVSGAVVPGAKLTIVNQATRVESAMVTNESGNYVAPHLPPGLYRITAEFSGSKTAVSADIAVQVSMTTRVDFTLQPRGTCS